MLTTPLFEVTRDNCIPKRIFHFLKLRSHALWLLVAFFLSLSLLIADQNQVRPIKTFRIYLMNLSAPLIRQTSFGIDWVQSGVKNFNDILSAHALNKRLRQENHALKKWQELAYRLSAENKSLKQQLYIVEEEASPMLTARVITYPSGLLTQNLLLNAGSRNGIKKGQPVIAENAVLGRIIEVGETTSRVLLITDSSSRIPVVFETSRAQAILSGTNSSLPKLIHFPSEEIVKQGERVITSGKGGVFPYGLLLGTVVVRDHVQYVRSPLVWDQLEYVQVLLNPPFSQDISND
ncbi:MAG: rod shape-determining protein MreC [Alphaproteobacteria bacterium]|nr:rod shape-determining protein MreC [Alphaproteobacteria bacterium]